MLYYSVEKRLGSMLAVALLLPSAGFGELKQLRPGWNLFSARQDVEVGREASAEVEREMPVVRDRDLDNYLDTLLRKLEKSPYARSLRRDGTRDEIFPFSTHVVYDRNINAFSLPGGPIFINTGVLKVADNEAQLAGVIAHEMSHVVLRHSTNQASKRNLVELPALLAGALAGNSILGQLTQIGIGFGAGSALLKFSRTDEAEADYNGAEIMADAGYNPLELARFFEKLEAVSGRQGALEQFLSDHPNPGNRVAAMNEEVRMLPRRAYVEDETGQLARIQDVVRRLPEPARRAGSGDEGGPVPKPGSARPSGGLRSYRGRSFSVSYPDNWRVQEGERADSVTIAPREGLVEISNGGVAVGYGLEVNLYSPQSKDAELERDTQVVIRRLRQANPDMRIGRVARTIEVANQTALLNTLYSRSPYQNEEEVDVLVSVARTEGLFYMVFIAPKSEFEQIQGTFEDIVRSVRFH
jgi:Zn-dependent protease with chaperone function